MTSQAINSFTEHSLNLTAPFRDGRFSDKTFVSDKFSGLIFDCDGTLTDSMPLHYEAWSTAMNRHGIEFGVERFYSMGGMPSPLIISILSKEQGVTVDPVAAAVEKEQLFLTLLDRLQPIENVCELARNNLSALPVSVASGGDRELVTAQLTHIGMLDVFKVLVCAEDTELHKPEPDVFLRAAELMGSDPAGCCVFEDSPLGFQAAISAGMHFVDVRPESMSGRSR